MGAVATSTTSEPIALSSSTLIGRAYNCDVRMLSRRVPNYWLEIRWIRQAWAWRALTAEGATRGVGKVLEHGWRLFPKSSPSSRIVLGTHAWVALVDPTPPQPLARCLRSGAVREGEELRKLLQQRNDGQVTRSALGGVDEAIVLEGEHVWRLDIPQSRADTPTQAHVPRLSDDLHSLSIDPDALRATFAVGEVVVSVQGEPVRTLLVYARECIRGGDGWLDNETAWRRWLMSGGNDSSTSDRLGWDRGKLRRTLRAHGVDDVGALFETRRQHGTPQIRLGVGADSIEIVGESCESM